MTEESGDSATPVAVKIAGDFSFPLNTTFQDVLRRYPKGERDFEVNLTNVEQLDASALGMLLQLRDHSRDGVSVTLINPSDAVRAALAEAPIGKLLIVTSD